MSPPLSLSLSSLSFSVCVCVRVCVRVCVFLPHVHTLANKINNFAEVSLRNVATPHIIRQSSGDNCILIDRSSNTLLILINDAGIILIEHLDHRMMDKLTLLPRRHRLRPSVGELLKSLVTKRPSSESGACCSQ